MRWHTLTKVLIVTLLLPTILHAVSPTELEKQIETVRQEREALIEEQKKLQAELEAINKESQTLGAAVKSLDTNRKKLAKDISITQSKIKTTDLTIQSLESTMTKKEQQIVIHRQAIADTLLALSQYDSQSLLFNLLAYVRLADIWGDRSKLGDLNDRLASEIDALRETRELLNEEKQQKEKMKKEQLSLANQLSGQKSVVEENKKAQEKLLSETKNKESEYQKMLADNLARQKQFENDLSRLESELRITLDPSLIPTVGHNVLAWPLDNIFVTSKFGVRSSGQHNGVDFRASMGTPVKSVLLGTVQGVGNTDENNARFRREGKPICVSYGGWVLIKHPNGLTSVYAHLSGTIVKVGQSVATGEVIGYSGGTPGVYGSGYSTGPHLHLGLFASQGVEIRPLTSSKGGCQNTQMPIALGKDAYLDPLAYLPSL